MAEKQADEWSNDSPRTVYLIAVQPGYKALPTGSSGVKGHSGVCLSHQYDVNKHVDLVPLQSLCGRVH